MGVTVTVNGLTMSHKGSGGHATNSTPDVCLTPSGPVPVPYSIISLSSDLVRGTKAITADGRNPIAVKGSAHSKCTGDESGTAKGVASGTNLHESTWISYSPNVYAEGKNIARLSDKMFMNNRNCICGVGGVYEPPLSITDPVLAELCKVFCQAREEWHECKRSGRSSCRKPSLRARDAARQRLGNPRSGLRQALGNKIGHAEQTFYGFADNVFDGARKVYDQSGLRRALERQVQRAVRNRVVQRGRKLASRMWTRLVPGLNIITGILDGIGTAMDAYDIIQLIRSTPDMIERAIRVQPDFAVTDADGAVEQVYDFKFDDPETGYLDDWQQEQEQERAYREISGQDPIKVDNETCECDRGPRGPSVPSV